MDIKSLIRANIASLAPYSTARDEYQGDIGVYLDANESPYDNGCNRYPDPHQKTLKKRLSEIKNIAVENIFLGNGSDEAIDLVYRMFCRPSIDNVVSIYPSYGMYKVAADINDIEFRGVSLTEDYDLDINAIFEKTDANTKIIFLCSPNNPSGNLLKQLDVITIIEKFNGIVIIDEAYIDFADEDSFITNLERYPNLIVLQTLSKAWGMAALRCGLAFASKEIIEVLNKIKYPYNINLLAQERVLEELKNIDKVSEMVSEIISERKMLEVELLKFGFVKKVYRSDANFLLIKVDDANTLYDRLINEGIIVRNRNSIKGCAGCLRITIGTKNENEKLLKVLRNI